MKDITFQHTTKWLMVQIKFYNKGGLEMDAGTITSLISSLGFPIVCVIALGYFSFYMVKETNRTNIETMKKLQERYAARENKLYEEIKENRKVNAKAIETIAHYAEKLDTIQDDVNEIKKDVSILINK